MTSGLHLSNKSTRATVREKYTAPQLIVFGTVGSLTKSGIGSLVESAGMGGGMQQDMTRRP